MALIVLIVNLPFMVREHIKHMPSRRARLASNGGSTMGAGSTMTGSRRSRSIARSAALYVRVGAAAIAVVANVSVAQVVAAPGAIAPTDSAAALSALIGEASRVNAQIPDRLRAYRARIESEMSLVVLDSGGRERTAQVEQVASDVRWRAPDRYDQRVIGYREQSVGVTFSLMSFFGGWTVPTLYGNRLQLGVTSATSPNSTVGSGSRALAVHPLSTSRDIYYT